MKNINKKNLYVQDLINQRKNGYLGSKSIRIVVIKFFVDYILKKLNNEIDLNKIF